MPLIVAPNQRPDKTLIYFEEGQCIKPCQNSCQNCVWMITPEVILEIRKKPNFLRWSTSLLFTSFYYLQEFVNYEKNTNREVAFICRCFQNVLKYWNHRLNFPKIRRSTFIQTQILNFSWYIWEFRFTVLQNYHCDTMKTRNFWVIKVAYDPI